MKFDIMMGSVRVRGEHSEWTANYADPTTIERWTGTVDGPTWVNRKFMFDDILGQVNGHLETDAGVQEIYFDLHDIRANPGVYWANRMDEVPRPSPEEVEDMPFEEHPDVRMMASYRAYELHAMLDTVYQTLQEIHVSQSESDYSDIVP